MIGKVNKICISLAILCLYAQMQGMLPAAAAAAAAGAFGGSPSPSAAASAAQPPGYLQGFLSQMAQSDTGKQLFESAATWVSGLDTARITGYLTTAANTLVVQPAEWIATKIQAGIQANNERCQQIEDDLRNELASLIPEIRNAALVARERARKQRDDANAELQASLAKARDSGLVVGKALAMAATETAKSHFQHRQNLELKTTEAREKAKGIAEAATNAMKELWNNPAQKVGIIAALIAAYYGIKLTAEHVAAQLQIPELALETSMQSFAERAMNWFSGTVPLESSISDVVLEPELAERIQVIADTLSITVKNGSYLPNLILYGPPGTGKTMVAQRMARSCGMHYLYTSGTHIEGNTTEGAIKQIQDLFTFAKNSDEKFMIIIDEAEVLFAKRSPLMNDKTRKLLNLLLTYFGTESRNVMIVLLTNRFGDLDEAVLSRADQKIAIGVPAAAERRAILEMYVKKYLFEGGHLQPKVSFFSNWFGSEPEMKKVTVAEDVLTSSELDRISTKLEGFVGRDISKLVLQILTTTYATEECMVTQEIVDRVVAMKLKEQAVEIELARAKEILPAAAQAV